MGVCIKGYQSPNLVLSKKEDSKTMSPRRHRERAVENASMGEEMRQLHAILEVMETTQRRSPDVGDINKAKSEEMEVEGVAGEEVAKECLLRVVVKMGAKEKIDVSMYEGNLDVEDMLDWVSSLDKYFDYEDFDCEKKVKHVVTRLKGHAVLW